MRYILVLISIVLLAPIVFKEPAANGQTKEQSIPALALEKEARVLSVENDKRSLAINNDIANATNKTIPNNKLRAEILRYKRLAYALNRENIYYKKKIFTLKRVLKVTYTKEVQLEKYLLDSPVHKIDTVIIRKKGVLKRWFNIGK